MSIEKLNTEVVEHLKHCIKWHQSTAILVQAADYNVAHVMGAVTRYVAEIESWGETDYTSYSSFNVAKQSLYLKYNILLDIWQKPHGHPDYSHISLECRNYNRILFDLELNSDDPSNAPKV